MEQNRIEEAEPLAAVPAAAPDFLPVPVRPRHDGWTPERQRAFVEALADTGSVRSAALAVGMTEQSAWRLRRRAGDSGFGAAWDAALRQGMRQLVAGAIERALHGTIVRRYYHGELVAEERVHSERLLLHLLGRAEKLLGGSAAADAMVADWDRAMERLGNGEFEHRGRLWKDRYGTWNTSFPPPEGFDGWSEGEPGFPGYSRCLTLWESNRIEEMVAARLDSADAERDSYFGCPPKPRLNRAALSERRG